MQETLNVRVERRGPVAIVTIDRQEALNAIDATVLEGLEQALSRMEDDPDVRVAIFTGAGKAFAAGGDIRAMRDMDVDGGRAFARRGHALLRAIEASRLVAIAAVNGFALGGGTELALACDLRIASARAAMGLPETTIGLFPGWGGSQRITRLVGAGRGRELVLTGRRVAAEEAREIGLVNEVVEPERLLERCLEVAGQICANGPSAVTQAKVAMVQGQALPLDYGLALEIESWLVNFATEDRVEGLSAFLEKRTPRWSGR